GTWPEMPLRHYRAELLRPPEYRIGVPHRPFVTLMPTLSGINDQPTCLTVSAVGGVKRHPKPDALSGPGTSRSSDTRFRKPCSSPLSYEGSGRRGPTVHRP